MNEPKGPGPGGFVAGIFLILFGLCLTLLGGGCTTSILLSLPMISGGVGGYDWIPYFLMSLVTLGAGVSLIWLAVKLMSGDFRK